MGAAHAAKKRLGGEAGLAAFKPQAKILAHGHALAAASAERCFYADSGLALRA